jgi:hypothetical protein
MDHDCVLLKPISFQDKSAKAIETSKIEPPLIKTENTFFVETPDDFNEVKKPANLEIIHDNYKEEPKSSPLFTIFNSKRKISVIVLIIVSTLSAFSTGTLINQNDYNNKLQQRYDVLYEYYLETQQRNVELTEELNNITIEMIAIQDKLYQVSSDYDLVITLLDELQEDYNQLLEDYFSLQAE